MIPQRAIEKKAKELDECRKRTLKNADNDIMITALQAVKSSFVDGATWINKQYEPLMAVLEAFLGHHFGNDDERMEYFNSLDQEFNKLKQHT